MNIFRSGTIATAIFAITALAVPAAAQTVTTLYNLPRLPGYPSPLMLDKSGALFGATSGRGKAFGQIYELSKVVGVWERTVIHKFSGSDGEYPNEGLIEDSSGALYGATQRGGIYGGGVVFQLTLSNGVWTETVLHNFGAPGDGSNPTAELIMDKNGTIYGDAFIGGGSCCGIVFELAQSDGVWNETILHSFGAPGDGQGPNTTLIMDDAGDLYGATAGGVIFELMNVGGAWTENILYRFLVYPESPDALVRGPNGTFYGLTKGGGTATCPTTFYCGTLFELSRSDGKWSKTVLHNFGLTYSDGVEPIVLIRNSRTNTLYGLTLAGGGTSSCTGGCGTIFEMTQIDGIWNETLLHSFDARTDASAEPLNMIEDHQKGIFYGTAVAGGGTVFELTP